MSAAIDGAGEERERLIAGVDVDFGGTVRTVPPLNLASLQRLQKRIATVKGFDEESIDTVIDAVHAALGRNYRGVTRDFVAENLDTSNMFSVMDSLMSVSGLAKRAANGAGKTPAVEALTGPTSTAT